MVFERSIPTLRRLGISSLETNNTPVQGNNTSVSPYCLHNNIYYPITINDHTLDSAGEKTKSKLTVKPDDDRILQDDKGELTIQLPETFVILIDQPIFGY